MSNLFCVICLDVIHIHPDTIQPDARQEVLDASAQNSGRSRAASTSSSSASASSVSEDELEEEVEDFIVSTPCGHLFHNNCLQRWFREEETNEANTETPLFLLRHESGTDVFSTRIIRIYRQTCPCCKLILLAPECIRLYPTEAPTDNDSQTGLTQNLKEAEEKLQELQKKYNELLEFHETTRDALTSEIDQLNTNFANVEKEHNEVEDKWISAMRKLDSDHRKTKAFYHDIFTSMGYEVPSLPYPDLSIANLIAQVLENRNEDVTDSEHPGETAETGPMKLQDRLVAIPQSQDTAPQGDLPSYTNVVGTNGVSASQNDSLFQVEGIKVGDKVVWVRQIQNPAVGVIKWIGKLKDDWTAGIEFEESLGANARLIELIKPLFTCKKGHGRLVSFHELMLYEDFFPEESSARSRTESQVHSSDESLDNLSAPFRTPSEGSRSGNLSVPSQSPSESSTPISSDGNKVSTAESKTRSPGGTLRRLLRRIIPRLAKSG